ncbi:hypothetical protein [Paenibacillus sp. IHBB 10380]|uniref:hypothetical protein n=1 Tax=Paenibacillus sp. IHBB 10380 TaxID=1566358 RepID=UPI0005CFCA1B|nr:hypothetical protein [Paenibacillus sp. IHBB 10380]AJS61009.1 hypothetical protein UB51_24020 [Paenibacillus sp. IHBB 10380]
MKHWLAKASAVFLSATLLVSVLQASETVQAKGQEANMVPSYEVKLLLDSTQVLDGNHSLTPAIQSEFSLSSPKQVNVEYFDTNNLNLDAQGWNVRFRKKENKDNYELNYKKRYAIQNEDIQAALTLANSEGFDITDDNYEAEVDWGYGKQTLSISLDKKVSTSLNGALGLPSEAVARGMLLDKLPGKLKDWSSSNWGKTQLQNSRAYGPVLASKYEGSWNGLEVDVEIWPIRDAAGTGVERIVEISFKTADYNDASTNRTALINSLNDKGWLVPADGLKTQLMLNRY